MKARMSYVGLMSVVIALSLSLDSRADVMTGMAAYWRLDESSGPTAFDSVVAYNATLHGSAAFVNDAQRGQVRTEYWRCSG